MVRLYMRNQLSSKRAAVALLAAAMLLPWPAWAAASTPAAVSTVAGATAAGAESNTAKAQALVEAAINMTDSDQAVKLLWQATELDPTFDNAYVYLGLYYNSRSDFAKVVQVYQKMVKYHPNEVSAYLNIGEAYMSFSPPRLNDALPYYQKAINLDPASSFAAFRLGQIYAQQGPRDQAIKYLKLASSDRVKHPTIASEADRLLRQMGAS